MSDSEDIVILDDIKALEECLARNVATAHPSATAGEASTAPIAREDAPGCSRAPRAKLEEQVDESAKAATSDAAGTRDSGNSSVAIDILAALETNKKLIEALQAAKREFSSLLDQVRRSYALVEERRKSPLRSRYAIYNAGMPYFRDRSHFFAPRNADANAKVARGELQVVNLPRVCRWSPQDRVTLERAIRREVAVSALEGREEGDSGDAGFPSGNLKTMVGPLGSGEFDWLKIAATDFEMMHTADECRVMWNVFLHPDVNKRKWSKKEDSKLIRLAKRHKFQDWQRIASDLGTKRTGYQCFMRYNAKHRNGRFKKGNWTKRDDDRMCRLVSKMQIGDFVHWGEVAKRMNCRTKQQVHVRWIHSLAPHLKKGRFTAEEDKALLDAVAKYGKNFPRIASAVLPCRTSVQLNDHYQTLLAHEVDRDNVWSVEDDAKLLSLYHELDGSWSKIATYFLTKNRTQVRHRYTAIQRTESEAVALPEMHRECQESLTALEVFSRSKLENESLSSEAGREVGEPKVQELAQRPDGLENVTDVDQRLLEYFQGIPVPVKLARRQDYYAPHELEDCTKRLYAVLRTLNANLDIPDELDDLLLSEKDQQLLTSLKGYPVNATKRRKYTLENVEIVRQKMFGEHHYTADEDPDDRFIPPPPFDIQAKTNRCQRNERIKMLDYAFLHDDRDLLVEVDDELETPENVTVMIGGEEGELEFRKIREMMIRPSAGERSYGRELLLALQRVYASPSMALARAKKSKDAEDRAKPRGVERVRLQETHEPLPTASGSPSSTKGNPVALIDCTLSFVGQANQPWESSPAAMEPNYSTLLGFRNILVSKLALDREGFTLDDDDTRDEGNERFEITRDGQLALMLLKERLTKLFKLPICMSEVPPPVVHEVSPKDLFKSDSTTGGTRKRKITNNKDVVVRRKRIKVKKRNLQR